MKRIEMLISFALAFIWLAGGFFISYALISSGHWITGCLLCLLILMSVEVRV